MQAVRSIGLTNLAGYREISWTGIRPDENLLVGRNGAGKTTTLEAIVIGLKFLQGRRTGDLLAGANLDARIQLELSDGSTVDRTLGEIRASQTPGGARAHDSVIFVHENRRPKSRVGKSGRSMLLQHPTRRHEFVLNELQALSRAGGDSAALWERVLDEASRFRYGGHAAEWEWVRQVLPRAGQKAARPSSCGQYDLLFFVLDVLRARDSGLGLSEPATVVIDNPDAYFHPALQGELIGFLERKLPMMQLFVASHSLKLLARAKPASVFWISRDRAEPSGRVAIDSVRDLEQEDRRVFYELYGNDATSAVLKLVLGLDSTEYRAFLCASAFPCKAVERPFPERDRQLSAVLRELASFRGPWALVDAGAGAGDFLLAAERAGVANERWRYVAVDVNPSDALVQQVSRLRSEGRIAMDSAIVRDMTDVRGPCDAVVFINSCHALGLGLLEEWLARGLELLRPAPSSRLIVHEVEVLTEGEYGFIMWTPVDYAAVLGAIPGVHVEEIPQPAVAGVPIHTTEVKPADSMPLPNDLRERLAAGFRAQLPILRDRLASEWIQRGSSEEAADSLDAGLRARRYAFVSQQLLHVMKALGEFGEPPEHRAAMGALDWSGGIP